MKSTTRLRGRFTIIVAAVFIIMAFITSGSVFAAIVAPPVGIADPAIVHPAVPLGVIAEPVPGIVPRPAVPLGGIVAPRAALAPRPAAPSNAIGEPLFNPFFNPFFGAGNPFFFDEFGAE